MGTLNRFFSLHYLFPFILAGLALVHIILLHDTGSNNPTGLTSEIDKVTFHDYFTAKVAYVFLLLGILISLFIFYSPNYLGDAETFIPANPLVTPVHIKPEWYFLFAYAILRCIPSKTLGVLALAAAVAVPIILAMGYSSTATVSFALLALTFSLLTVVGRMAIVKHYFLMSQCLSLMYFFLVTVLS